jgi:hypothetical protein
MLNTSVSMPTGSTTQTRTFNYTNSRPTNLAGSSKMSSAGTEPTVCQHMLNARKISHLGLVVSVVVWAGCGLQNSPFTPAEAAGIISRTPEFIVTRRLV